MRRIVTPLLVTAFALLAYAPVTHAQTLLFDYVGFDYQTPNSVPFGDPFTSYTGVGTVPFLFAPLTSNTSNNEYTYVMSGLTPVSQQVFGQFKIINYSAGTITLYEDAKLGGTLADFGVNPPNPTVPSTFTDGTPILVGALTNFQFVLDTASGTGSFEAVFTVNGGSQLGNFPLNQRKGWTFSGATVNALNIPVGYAHQVDGQTFLDAPVSSRKTSWGRLKAGYR
jgi:hypothetical protein